MSALARSRVLIVGAGGLGCPASLGLARAGIGAITLVDPDVVDPSNLHRQLWHRTPDVGRPKVDSAATRLIAAFPRTEVRTLRIAVVAQNAEELFRAHDLVIDGTDGMETKFLLSDTSVLTGRPLVHGGVLGMEGQAMAIAPGGPCLRCLFEEPPPPDTVPTCAQAGVIGAVAGVIGVLQALIATEVLRATAHSTGVSTLHVFDGASLRTRKVLVRRAADCSACSARGRAAQLVAEARRPACAS